MVVATDASWKMFGAIGESSTLISEDELSRSIFLAIAEPKPPARSPELGRRGIQSQTR
jgi:hypothetical protein